MKKIFIFALAAATMAVGCQKLQGILTPSVGAEDDGAPVPVVFGTNVATVSTKAAVENADDLKPFHVYGISDELTTFTTTQDFLVDKEFAGTEATADGYPTGSYYGVAGETYSFYGYYIDKLTTTPTFEGNTINIPVTITGQEDLMIGLTNKDNDLGSISTLDADDLYSAKSARRGVTPKLVFDHKLVRFDFVIINGSELTDNVEVSQIDLLNTTTNGKLIITHGDEPSGELVKGADRGDKADLSLTGVNGAALVTLTNATAVNASQNAGTIMPMPEEEGYMVKLHLTQNNQTAYQELPLVMSGENSFVPGTRYTVKVKVYGMEAVIVAVEVTPWNDGGSFEYDPDSDQGVVFNPDDENPNGGNDDQNPDDENGEAGGDAGGENGMED